MKKYAFFLLCFLITTIQVIAHEQTENLCTQKLKEAQKSYDNGLIERVPEMLKSCLDNGFSRNEKLQAYRLQILAYLFLDDNAAAEESLLKLLKIDPEYKVNTAVDPIELITLYDSYRTLPLYSIGFMGGVNKTIVSAYEPYGVNNVNEESEDYKSLMGYQLGVFADILLKGKFQINTGLSYNVKNYKSSNLLLGYTKLDIKEAQSWLDFPLLLKFTTGKHKLKFFLEAGLQASLLLRSNTTFL